MISVNELQALEKRLQRKREKPCHDRKIPARRPCFPVLAGRAEPTKELTVCYKEGLTERYEAASVNSMLAGINSYLSFSGRADCRVKPCASSGRCSGARNGALPRVNTSALSALRAGQIGIVMQTICGTGIRVSELRHITAEAVREGRAAVRNKGKTRVILIPAALRRLLLGRAKRPASPPAACSSRKTKRRWTAARSGGA